MSNESPRRWHERPLGAFLVRLGATLLRLGFLLVGATYRLDLRGREHIEKALDEKSARVLSFWHNRVVLGAWFLYNHLSRKGFDVLVLASLSRDGELVTQLARQWGLSVVRGSSSRGGRDALRKIYRAVRGQGSSPVIIPDGPRGPMYEMKVGALILAQMSQTPILPMGFAASRFFQIKSWDRLIVPWPFARIVVVVGEPETIPKGLSDEALEAERLRVERLISRLTREAEEALSDGVTDS